jgi:putative transposase
MKRKRFSVEHMVAVLNPTHESPGNPEETIVDNGSAFTGQILNLWAYQHQVNLDFSRPRKPTNAFIELFNGPLRRECLNTQWFLALVNARKLFDAWW